MAKRTVVELIDDLTDTPIPDGGGRTVEFSLEGVRYEIDLTNEHIDELRAALEPYVSKGERVGGRVKSSSSAARGGRSASRASENAAIREWAVSKGFGIGARGRISEEIRAAYAAR